MELPCGLENQRQLDVGGVQWLVLFVPSLSKECECDFYLNCIYIYIYL